MVSNANASVFSPLKAELKTRMKIAVFMVLLWQFTRIIIFPVAQNAALLYSLYGLLEISSMVVIFRFSGNSNVGKDINEFNLYALIIHIVGIPVYYLTEIPLAVHDNSIWGLFILSICRLFYFSEAPNGEYKGIPSLSLLARMQKKAARFNHWSELLFFGSAIPLWYIIYQTNDSAIAISSVGAMVFIYLITDAMKTQAVLLKTGNNVVELNSDETILLEIFKSKSAMEKALILKHAETGFSTIAAEAEIARENQIDGAKYLAYKIIAGTLFIFLIALAASTFGGIPQARSDYYRFGYKQGFLDAKEGKRQLTAAERERHVACHLHDQQTNPPGPRDPFCNE